MKIIKAVLIFVIICIAASIGGLYLAPQKVTSFTVDLERKRASLTRKEIAIPGNLHYVYLEGGKGEPLILLHGFGANKDNFIRTARFLTPHYRVVIPDHIGFGESSHPKEADYGAGAQAARIRTLARALGITKVRLGGSSMGGHIAMMYAVLYPDEVQSLWLLDPGGVRSAPPSELSKIIAKTGKNPLMARNEDDFAGIFQFVMASHPFIPRPILNVMAQERISNYDLEIKIAKDMHAESIEKYAARIKIPTLIVFGDKDRVINPAAAEILHKLMPNAEVIMMKGLGHLPMLEQPAQTAADYLKFVQRVESGHE